MFKIFSANNTRKCVDVLDLLVDQCNNTIHSSIKMTPKEASRKENENKVWTRIWWIISEAVGKRRSCLSGYVRTNVDILSINFNSIKSF